LQPVLPNPHIKIALKDPRAVTFGFTAFTINGIPLNTQFIFMEMEKYLNEMDGKILLLDNRKFIFSIGFIGVYYVSYLCFLAHVIVQSGGFH
jgi:hypothetical protein